MGEDAHAYFLNIFFFSNEARSLEKMAVKHLTGMGLCSFVRNGLAALPGNTNF